MPPWYPLSPPALGGLRLRQGEEDVRKLTPGGLLLRTYLSSLPTGGNTAPSPPSPSLPLLPVHALSLKNPLRRAHRATPESRSVLFLSLVWKQSRRICVSSLKNLFAKHIAPYLQSSNEWFLSIAWTNSRRLQFSTLKGAAGYWAGGGGNL